MIDLNIDLQSITDWLSVSVSVFDLSLPDWGESSAPEPEPETDGETPGGESGKTGKDE